MSALASEQVWKEDPDSFWKFHEALYKAQPDNDTMETSGRRRQIGGHHGSQYEIKRDKLVSSLNDKRSLSN
ncbi:hypothetical protein PO124_21455 [Bacillus licheniformis]|nr:hypothetical protein [Bacillus licheniformis]